MSNPKLTYEILAGAVSGGAAAIRARTRLQPAGGSGDKVFPPTFGDTVRADLPDGSQHMTRYAVETRRINGESVLCVLLDSVASQANRYEEALQRAWDEDLVDFPLVRVDFTGETHDDPALDLSTIGGDGYLTSLEAPHRLADALLRDSMLGDFRFRASDPGRSFTEASPHNATAVYKLSPNALVFGMWDSTGPKGGQGSKFQRALVSEIVGMGVKFGNKTASRIDPAQIELNAGPVYRAADSEEEWTIDESAAAREKGKAVLFSRRKSDKAGKPSSLLHGNIKPSIDSVAGGVTLDYAEQITVLSIPALRRLRFPKNVGGSAIPRDQRTTAENAARTALAALGLAAVAFQRLEGFDLRSRCAFVPDPAGPLAFHVLDRDGTSNGPFALAPDDAEQLVKRASEAAEAAGMGWDREPIDLVPAPKLVELIRKSRDVAAQRPADQEDEEAG
ncbi:MAG: type I-G CRISPR-associated RAMP protein Csb1/Cas7g [Gemmatimonadaceae bacterium]